MRIIEKAQKIKIYDFLMNDQNIMFGYTPPIENLKKSKNVNQLILMNVQNIVFDIPVLLKEYNLFSQNNESSLEE